ncbi:N-acetylmuramoyl-L-alanine amidase [Synechococcus moorigangaii CMS01]|nr:N-acetylmuramoyl-L-alanine amidase [Synechococcus moorigangaii CMS01]
MRFFWFFLTLLTLSTWQLPAWAGQLVFWEFNTQRRQLQFRTNERVQPQAQLISDPSRLVIDLPGTVLGSSTINRTYGGTITRVRLGQFSPDVTRLVVELAPGYTLDPDQIQFEGRSPTDWVVNLPEPEPIPAAPPSQGTPELLNNSPSSNAPPGEESFLNNLLRVTQQGLFIDLEPRPGSRITTERKGDRLEFTLRDLQLPRNLEAQTLNINRYRVRQIQFEQPSRTEARITLNLEPGSPPWRALYTTYGDGGLVLLPNGGTTNLSSRDTGAIAIPTPQASTAPSPPEPQAQQTIVEALELARNNTQLVIRGNNRLQANGSWNRNEGTYQIRINNARLAQPVRGPQWGGDSPISRIAIRQENANTVLVQIEPANGVTVGNLNQPNAQFLALDLNRPQAASPLFVPPATNAPPAQAQNPVPSFRPPRSNIVVTIDPGHGGRDPGAVGIGGLQEKNAVLPISQEVARILQQNGIGVRMTRNTDVFVSLEDRARQANAANADLFVSIHANAISMSRPDINGFEVFYFQSGRGLAESIHRNVMRRISIRDRGVKTARFYVLRNTSMPSALVETGFVTGREDAPRLNDPAFRSQMAQAIAAGILEYIQNNVR